MLCKMSRPVDGHHAFFPFGNPFRMFSKRPHLSPLLRTLLNDFELMLAASLTNLKPNHPSEILSLSWMRKAIESLSLIHTNIKNLITDLEFPVSDWDEKWVNMYLDGSVKLLDVCIDLSSELSRLDQGQLFLHYVMQTMEHSSNSSQKLDRAEPFIFEWKGKYSFKSHKLENCHNILKKLAETPYSEKMKSLGKSRLLMRALYGVKAQTVVVCSVIIAALSGCSKPMIELHVSDKFLWSEAFNELQSVLISEFMEASFPIEKGVMLKEVEAVKLRLDSFPDSCGKEDEVSSEIQAVCLKFAASPDCADNELGVDELHGHGGAPKLKEFVLDLAESSEKLSEGLDLLSRQIDSFFQIVLTGRDALLANLRASNGLIENNGG